MTRGRWHRGRGWVTPGRCQPDDRLVHPAETAKVAAGPAAVAGSVRPTPHWVAPSAASSAKSRIAMTSLRGIHRSLTSYLLFYPIRLNFGLYSLRPASPPIRLPPSSPNSNAYAERFVRSIKNECLNKLVLFGENHLRAAVHAA
jgi:hypothetical protein